MNLNLPYNYTPRPYQVALYDCLKMYRRAVAIWNRRAGKDKTALNLTTKETFKRVGTYYYFLPTYSQARKIIWDGMDDTGFPFMGHIPGELRENTNNSEMKIKLKNKSLFQLVGTDNIDAIVGSNPVGCVFSEFSLQDPKAWDFIRPILAENNGWAIFLSTPRGHNHLYKMYEMARGNPKWFSQLLTVDDTKAISEEKIQDEREAGMSEDLIRQEFYCSFEASMPGAYYARQMREVREQGRICGVPVESGTEVNTFWDLGWDNPTCIWLAQNIGREIHLVGSYSNAGEDLVHYVNWLKDWRDSHSVTFGTHYLPHDGKNKKLQSGKSDLDILEGYGLKCDAVKRPNRKEAGIENVRQIFSRLWFDKVSCATGEYNGVEALTQYRKEYNEKNRIYAVRPVDDWTTHYADALQTMALYEQEKIIHKAEPAIRRRPMAVAGQGWMGA